MSLQHFFTSPELITGARAALQGDEAHHASSALRIRAGETISIADGTGNVYDAVVLESTSDEVVGRIILKHTFRPPKPKLVLWQGLAKGTRMDLAISRAVELGASVIAPFVAERSVPRWQTPQKVAALKRWEAIGLSSAKVCRAPWLTKILPLEDKLGDLGGGLSVVLHEEATESLGSVLPSEPPSSVSIVVGPEGGLTQAEVDAAEANGAKIVKLGERLLRTETAGSVALSVVSFAYGILG